MSQTRSEIRDKFVEKQSKEIIAKLTELKNIGIDVSKINVQIEAALKAKFEETENTISQTEKYKGKDKSTVEIEIANDALAEITGKAGNYQKSIFDEEGTTNLEDIKEAMKNLGIPLGTGSDADLYARNIFIQNQLTSISPPIDKLKLKTANPTLSNILEKNKDKIFVALQNNEGFKSGKIDQAVKVINDISEKIKDPTSDKKTILANLKTLKMDDELLAKQIFVDNQFNSWLSKLPENVKDEFSKEKNRKAILDHFISIMGDQGKEIANINNFIDNLTQKIKSASSTKNIENFFSTNNISVDKSLSDALFSNYQFENLIEISKDHPALKQLIVDKKNEVLTALIAKKTTDINSLIAKIKDIPTSKEALANNLKNLGINLDLTNINDNKKIAEVYHESKTIGNAASHYNRFESIVRNKPDYSELHAMLINQETKVKEVLGQIKRDEVNKANVLLSAVFNATTFDGVKTAMGNLKLNTSDENVNKILSENIFRNCLDKIPSQSNLRKFLSNENGDILKKDFYKPENAKALNELIANVNNETNKVKVIEILRELESSNNIVLKNIEKWATTIATENRTRIFEIKDNLSTYKSNISEWSKESEKAFHLMKETEIAPIKEKVDDAFKNLKEYQSYLEYQLSKLDILSNQEAIQARQNELKEELKLVNSILTPLETIKNDLEEALPSNNGVDPKYLSLNETVEDIDKKQVDDKIKELAGQGAKEISQGKFSTEQFGERVSSSIKEDKVRISRSTFGDEDKQQVAITVQTKKGSRVDSNFHFYGEPFKTSRTGWFPSLPHSSLLKWAQVSIHDHIALCDPKDRGKPIYINGTFPTKEHREAIILMCEHHGILYYPKAPKDMKITSSKIERLEKHLKENPEILKDIDTEKHAKKI
jgi:hypothetical protein